MKWFTRILVFIVFLGVLGLTAGWFYAKSRVPAYHGNHQLKVLSDSVIVKFDSHGIPHIKATNAQDAYRALGYVMASERLFQMELVRRVGSGELAEVIGVDALESDRFFRTIGVGQHARRSADDLRQNPDSEALQECLAFLEGINNFILSGKKPLEFQLAGIPMREFELEDVYAIAGYIAWSFALAVQTDLLATELEQRHGADWLNATSIHADQMPPFHPVCNDLPTDGFINFPDFLGRAGIPVFTGSNAWAVAPSKTKAGKAILCNDTHIGFGIPQVWYEAAIEFPGMHFYGNFLPGIPYALVGHTKRHAWGLTMFENDDIDFYREIIQEDGENVVLESSLYPLQKHIEEIAVKGQPSIEIEIRSTRNGPIINDAVQVLSDLPPVAMHWEYVRGRNRLLEAFRRMGRASSLDRFQSAVEQIHAPGLNVVYADVEDNIAWWACARLPIRPEGVNSKTVLDGSTTAQNSLGYYPFEFNPQCINPEAGFLYSANEQPDAVDSVFVPGYYVPPTRSKRIAHLLESDNKWSVEKMQNMLVDVVNEDDAAIAAIFTRILEGAFDTGSLPQQCLEILASWNGSYTTEASAPVLFQPLQVGLMQRALQDKMSAGQFDRMRKTHWFRRLMIEMLLDPDHHLWDNFETPHHENLNDYLPEVFAATVERVAKTQGKDPSAWQWGNVHAYGPQHPFKDIPVIGRWLSSSPTPAPGSNETISQFGFTPTTETVTPARYGAQMRIIVDLDAPENSISIAPFGQSGHRLSPYYNDQTALYVNGQYRPQTMTSSDQSKALVLFP